MVHLGFEFSGLRVESLAGLDFRPGFRIQGFELAAALPCCSVVFNHSVFNFCNKCSSRRTPAPKCGLFGTKKTLTKNPDALRL